MAIALSGTIINQTFVGATKQNIIDGIETALLAAGWGTVSGHGTTNLLMQTATTPQGLSGRFRFKDLGANCVAVAVESTNGSRIQPLDTNNGGYLLPGTAKAYRVIACPYQFFVFGQYVYAAREFVCGGVPYLPPVLQDGSVWECIWMGCNSYQDSNGTLNASFRTELINHGNYQANFNGNMTGQAFINTGNIYPGFLGLMVPCAGTLNNSNGSYQNNCHRYHNDALITADPLLYFGLLGNWDEAKVRGQLWDALVVTEALTADSIVPIDGHDMWVLSSPSYGSNVTPRGGLLLAVS